MEPVVRITSKGQVTIPAHIREERELLPGTEVEFVLSRDSVYLRKLRGSRRGRRVTETLRGKGNVQMSIDQIMALTRGEP
jgi:AbrB family looped-hinge helix DNA binding protein